MTESRNASEPEPTRPAGWEVALDTRGEVSGFVAAVRARLVDLSEEEREELVGGLDADMSDLVAERGVDALPEPVAYATELRSAAGFTPEPAPVGEVPRVTVGQRVTRLLDRAHERWEGFAGGLPGSPWEFVVSLRPAWWVLRAWVALQVLDLFWGGGSFNYGLSVVPSLYQWGIPLLLLAVALSVQLGRGKLWPGRERSGAVGRVLLLGLNAFAVAMVPTTFGSVLTAGDLPTYSSEPVYAQPADGLVFNGNPVGNIYPYDARGNPLTGVQLVDQNGRRLPVTGATYDEVTGTDLLTQPWMNGRTELFSVFPLLEQTSDPETGEMLGEPRLQTPPFASLPPVKVEGATPSVLVPPAPVKQKQTGSRARSGG